MTDLQDDTSTVPTAFGRRKLLGVAGAFGAAVVVAACSDDGDKKADSGAGTTTTATKDNDVAIATFGAGLELLAAQTYKAGLDAATAGKLGPVPPAVATFATTAMAHHQAASDALATAAGGITPVVPADIQQTVNDAFAKVKDVAGLANLALDLELKAASTYLDVLPKLKSADAIKLVGSIMPIERQHAAILLFVLGKYPVPDSFATPDLSLAPKL